MNMKEELFFYFSWSVEFRSITDFKITVMCGLKFYWCLRTLSLKFQKATSRIEVFQVLKYPKNYRLHATLMLKV